MEIGFGVVLLWLISLTALAQEKWLHFAGGEGAGHGQHIVLVSGDEEYRSEESAPMLAKILSQHHGFETTVLFSWSKDGEFIDPNHSQGVVGWGQLDNADLMIIGTRLREFTPATIKHLGAFLNAGKPVIGFRTATHAFQGRERMGSIEANDWGLKILGERWVNHHGAHRKEGTRGVIEKGAEGHVILNSVTDVFGPSDVYTVSHLTKDDTVLLRGAVTVSLDPQSAPVVGSKNEPMMPLAWLHQYVSPDGKSTGQALCTTMGASVDFLNEDLRRFIVNGSFFLLDLEVPEKAEVGFVDPFSPSFYGFWKGEQSGKWKERALTAAHFGLGQSLPGAEPMGTPAWPFGPVNK